jgi:hypothetical protein
LLPSQGEILLFEAFGLLGHFFHFFAECEKEIVAIVERVFDLLQKEGVVNECLWK